jgi:two-component system, response regulator, stage 0 sporulation protein A
MEKDMNPSISVLIADDDIEFNNNLSQYLSRVRGIKICGAAYNGYEALELIAQTAPDVVVLDVIMSGMDGIGVLEKLDIVCNGKRPMVIMLSAVGLECFIRKTLSLGADYYILKPFDIESLVSKIEEAAECIERGKESFGRGYFSGDGASKYALMNKVYVASDQQCDKLSEMELGHIIAKHIQDAGIPSNIPGFNYICDAILSVIYKPRIKINVTAGVYPAVASKYGITTYKVERVIRTAIEKVWNTGNQPGESDMPGCMQKNWRNRPTNSQFIATIADRVRLSINEHIDKS